LSFTAKELPSIAEVSMLKNETQCNRDRPSKTDSSEKEEEGRAKTADAERQASET
jgi:hypothetical protein